MSKSSLILAIILAGTAGTFGVFVWPTPYQIENVKTGVDSVDWLYHVNRFTGAAERIFPPPKPTAEKKSGQP